MSEFDQFASADPPADQGQQQEEDPAAAFLAREQDQMAELEGEMIGSDAAPAQEPESGAVDPFAQQPPEDNFGAAEDSSAAVGAIDEVLDAFDPAFQSENAPTNTDFGFDDDDQAPEDPYAAVKVTDTERAEPEKIRIWRENQKIRLEEKDEEAEKKKAEWRAIARKELEDWYKHLDEQLEKTKKSNRESEDAFVQERDETQPGHEWERICRLCDFNPKAARNTKDVSRMRSILLQLKQTPLVR